MRIPAPVTPREHPMTRKAFSHRLCNYAFIYP